MGFYIQTDQEIHQQRPDVSVIANNKRTEPAIVEAIMLVQKCNKYQDKARETGRLQIKSKCCASGGWGFEFHVTETEGILEDIKNPTLGKEKCKV